MKPDEAHQEELDAEEALEVLIHEALTRPITKDEAEILAFHCGVRRENRL